MSVTRTFDRAAFWASGRGGRGGVYPCVEGAAFLRDLDFAEKAFKSPHRSKQETGWALALHLRRFAIEEAVAGRRAPRKIFDRVGRVADLAFAARNECEAANLRAAESRLGVELDLELALRALDGPDLTLEQADERRLAAVAAWRAFANAFTFADGPASVFELRRRELGLPAAAHTAWIGVAERRAPAFSDQYRDVKTWAWRKRSDRPVPTWPSPWPPGMVCAVSWVEARETTLKALAQIHPIVARRARALFNSGGVEASPSKIAGLNGHAMPPIGKRSARAVITFEGTARSAATVAHELAHAAHMDGAARAKGWLRAAPPLAAAETAALIAENAFLKEMAVRASVRGGEAAIAAMFLDDCFALLVRQASLSAFEAALYGGDPAIGAQLDAGLASGLWMEANKRFSPGIDWRWHAGGWREAHSCFSAPFYSGAYGVAMAVSQRLAPRILAGARRDQRRFLDWQKDGVSGGLEKLAQAFDFRLDDETLYEEAFDAAHAAVRQIERIEMR